MKLLTRAGLTLLAVLIATPAMSQRNYNGVRIMIAADDADPRSVVRSSDMYHRIQLPLNEELQRYGYTAIFEDALAAELNFDVQDRMSKQRSLALAKLACKANQATLCPRVLVLIRTQATATDLGFGTAAKVRMTGEMIDVNTNAVLGGWEAPTLDFPAGKGCTDVCIEDIVGDNARKVALNLGDTLRRMLDRQAFGATNSTASAGPVTGAGGARGVSAGGGLVNSYMVEFERFDMQEILPLKAMMEAFPDSIEIAMPTGGNNSFSMNLVTRARADRVLEWLHLMMEDRGYNLSRLKITTSGTKFIIDRIVDDGYRPTSATRRTR